MALVRARRCLPVSPDGSLEPFHMFRLHLCCIDSERECIHVSPRRFMTIRNLSSAGLWSSTPDPAYLPRGAGGFVARPHESGGANNRWRRPTRSRETFAKSGKDLGQGGGAYGGGEENVCVWGGRGGHQKHPWSIRLGRVPSCLARCPQPEHLAG